MLTNAIKMIPPNRDQVKGRTNEKMNEKKSNTKFQVGEILTVSIKRIGINGEGVGYYNRQVIFIPNALPDEKVVAKVVKVERNFAYGSLLKVVEPSPYRVVPPCPVYAECGGCQLQHFSYEGQLKAKRDLVIEAFQRYTSLKHPPVREAIGMENPWSYRNKAQFQVGIDQGKVVTGLYSAGSHRLVDLTGCPIQHPQVNEIIQITRDVLEELEIPIYNERKRTGLVRTIVARASFETGESQLTLVTRAEELPRLKELILELRTRLPQLVGISQNINRSKTSLIFGDETRLLWGKEKIKERLGEVEFSLSPRAFFQLNPEQTVKLYNLVKEAAALTGKERVVDAYCGVGTIGLWLAPDAKEVRGMEIIEEAVQDARENARLAGYKHVHFEVGKAEVLLPRWAKEGFKADVVVVDPPRTGLDKYLMDAIIKVKPSRMVYVSCNPSTLAKDCDYLMKQGFVIKWIQPIDMFPQTSHVECVTLMSRVEK